MKSLQFTGSNAQRIYYDYISRCKKAVRLLSSSDQEDCLMEINSHIYEYLENNKSGDETADLLTILERLGNPDETLKEVIAVKKTQQAVKSYNPKHLAESLALNIKNGVFYIILSLLFLLSGTFFVLAMLKLFFYKTVGCYVGNGAFYFGFSDGKSDAKEVLGHWFIPIVVATGLLVYYLIILLLKIKTKNK
jgi:uncharacterized membrane protein